MSLDYFLNVRRPDGISLGEVARVLAGDAPVRHPGSTELDGVSFRVRDEDADGAATCASNYGVSPNAYVLFSLEKDRSVEGMVSLDAAVRRFVENVGGDFVLVSPIDTPLLWRHDGRVVINRANGERALAGRASAWHVGTEADLPPRTPRAAP